VSTNTPHSLKAFAKYLREIVSPKAPNGLSWRTWGRIANITEYIDFGCRFVKSGKCKNIRNKGGHRRASTATGCCRSFCTYNNGYLRKIPKSAEKEILSLWSTDSGFFRKGKGCVLPRKWRDEICLLYECSGKLREYEYFYGDFYDYFIHGGKVPPTRDILKKLKKEGVLFKQGRRK